MGFLAQMGKSVSWEMTKRLSSVTGGTRKETPGRPDLEVGKRTTPDINFNPSNSNLEV